MSLVGCSSPSRTVSGTMPGTSFETSPSRGITDNIADTSGEPLGLIIQSFVPHVAIYASRDTEALIAEKGCTEGLWGLLRPFGERIQGKVAVRDSNGITRTFEDFSIRFTQLGDNVGLPDTPILGVKQTPSVQGLNGVQESSSRDRKALAEVEAVVERHLSYAEESSLGLPRLAAFGRSTLGLEAVSPYYSLYLRRLLSGFPITTHETFAHPVACIIAISSRNETPIAELRNLYAETSQGEKRLPPWVDGDYLRYYVLVHDEENDDISRSMALFEQMKRHLGLHCHLLRLRCSQCAETDDDSMPLPRSDWMSAAEELAEIQRCANEEEFADPTRYIFESDATAIRTFVRELVTQSIVPTMERHISLWNDQVASRRRGIAGRLMNFSRKWAGFGGGSRSASAGDASDSYDMSGFYRADAPEAIMRKLADFAFMLRDWKLAQSTYDLLRSDFGEAKAWKYHAAANEMSAVSLLLASQNMVSKGRAESIDQMLESALYSYGTRCSAPYGVTRSLTLGHELLRLWGGPHVDDAGRWGLRLLESKMLGRVGDALIKERLAVCYASKGGVGSSGWGSRWRKSAAWSVLAADAWCQQTKYLPAQKCLCDAQGTYDALPHQLGISRFASAVDYMASLQHELAEKLPAANRGAWEASESNVDGDAIDEESEALTDLRGRRASVSARVGALETAPLHGEEALGQVSVGEQGFG